MTRYFLVEKVALSKPFSGFGPKYVDSIRYIGSALDLGDFFLLTSNDIAQFLDNLAQQEDVVEVFNSDQPLDELLKGKVVDSLKKQLVLEDFATGAELLVELQASANAKQRLKGIPETERAEIVARMQTQLTADTKAVSEIKSK